MFLWPQNRQSKVCHVVFTKLLSYQVTRLPGYQVTRLPGYQVTRLPGYQVTRLPGYQVTRLPGYQVTRLPGYQVTRLPGYQVTRLPGYQVTRLPSYQSTRLPGYQYTRLPVYQVTSIPGYQVTSCQGSRVGRFKAESTNYQIIKCQMTGEDLKAAERGCYPDWSSTGAERFGAGIRLAGQSRFDDQRMSSKQRDSFTVTLKVKVLLDSGWHSACHPDISWHILSLRSTGNKSYTNMTH